MVCVVCLSLNAVNKFRTAQQSKHVQGPNGRYTMSPQSRVTVVNYADLNNDDFEFLTLYDVCDHLTIKTV